MAGVVIEWGHGMGWSSSRVFFSMPSVTIDKERSEFDCGSEDSEGSHLLVPRVLTHSGSLPF